MRGQHHQRERRGGLHRQAAAIIASAARHRTAAVRVRAALPRLIRDSFAESYPHDAAFSKRTRELLRP